MPIESLSVIWQLAMIADACHVQSTVRVDIGIVDMFQIAPREQSCPTER